MKAILTDYSRWSSARKLGYMESVPDRFFRIHTTDSSGMCDSSFAIYDVGKLEGISAGDGETIVGIKGKKSHIYCDGVVFLEDGDDIKERYVEFLKKDGSQFKVREIVEIDMKVVKDELSKRTLSVKERMKSVCRDMVKSGNIVPDELSSCSFMDKEEELLSLGSYIYRGVGGIHEYLYKKLGVSPDSVRMFNISSYEYPLVCVCLKGDLNKTDGAPNMMRRIEDSMKTVSCYRLPKDYSYTDIDFLWKDTEFYLKDYDAFFIVCQWRPEKDEVEDGRKCIERCVSEGLSLEKIGEDVEMNFPGEKNFWTSAGREFLNLMCEWLNEKVIVKDSSSIWDALISKFSGELFVKVVNHVGDGSSGQFMYRGQI